MKTVSAMILAAWLCTVAVVRGQGAFFVESAVDLGMDVGSWSAPTTADWDNDGRKDLIVGQYSLGKVRLYMNEGTDRAPLFGGFTYIKSHGGDISTPDRGC
jgi:hypothetical protein